MRPAAARSRQSPGWFRTRLVCAGGGSVGRRVADSRPVAVTSQRWPRRRQILTTGELGRVGQHVATVPPISDAWSQPRAKPARTLPRSGRRRPHEPTVKASLLDFRGRARRGTSGALNLQSAPAGLNSHPRSPYSNATASSDVEDRVPRSGDSRIVSGPEGSSTKRSSSGAAERPGPSRSSRRARDRGDRRWVHGTSSVIDTRS